MPDRNVLIVAGTTDSSSSCECGPVIAGPAGTNHATPAAVQTVARGRPVRPVWVNEAGGTTFEVAGSDERLFMKWAPRSSGLDLDGEAARLQWAVAYAPVPRLLDTGADEDGCWIVTAALHGEMAVAERWKADPRTAVTAVGEGLRALHEALPVDHCPFTWGAHERLDDARHRAERGRLDPARWHPVHHSLTVAAALDELTDVPPVDEPVVVCHGDSCAPNTLMTDDGRWSGHVDLGDLGVADRWADLAIATWSTTWNYGPGWETRLLDAYGISPDPDRTRYYRLLWDVGP